MKKVIIICLLSVSLCFSAPADEKATSPPQTLNNPPNPPNKPPNAENGTPHPPVPLPPNASSDVTTPDKVPTATQKNNETTAPNINTNVHQNTDAQNAKDTTQNTNPAGKTTDTTNTTPDKTRHEPPKDVTQAPPVADKTNKTEVKNDTKIDHKTGTNGTAVDTKTTEAPKEKENHDAVQARSFDGASFVGGIILTLGLLAIGFMGFKYYKTQTERNYHTL